MNAYHNIRVQIAGKTLSELRELRITQRFNDHAQLILTALLPVEAAETFFEAVGLAVPVEVSLVEGVTVKQLFCGMTVDIAINSVQEVYHLRLEGKSSTYNLDMTKWSRSFQNHALTYQNLIKSILAGVGGSDCKVEQKTGGRSIEHLLLQYQETNWEFLKRIASELGLGLIPDATAKGAKFWFGLPENADKRELVNYNCRVRKKLDRYRELNGNGVANLEEDDYIFYELEVDEVFQVGERLNFRKKSLVVAETIAEIRQGMLKYTITLVSEKGLRQKPCYNQRIAGLALEGKVIEVKDDQVKLKLDIDGGQKAVEACWFSYASGYTAEGHTGAYCMPELGDTVKLSFPTEREELAYVINSIRRQKKDGEPLQDPAVKYFRTVNGVTDDDAIVKEVLFRKQELRMTLFGKNDETLMVQIDDQKGIIIASEREIAITAKGDIDFKTEQKLSITAAEGIELRCKESRIAMDDVIQVEGVKTRLDM